MRPLACTRLELSPLYLPIIHTCSYRCRQQQIHNNSIKNAENRRIVYQIVFCPRDYGSNRQPPFVQQKKASNQPNQCCDPGLNNTHSAISGGKNALHSKITINHLYPQHLCLDTYMKDLIHAEIVRELQETTPYINFQLQIIHIQSNE